MTNGIIKFNFSAPARLYFLFLLFFVGMILGSFVSPFLPDLKAASGLRSSQFVTSVCLFLLPSCCYLLLFRFEDGSKIFSGNVGIKALFLSVLLLPVAIPFISVINSLSSCISFESIAPGLQAFFETSLAKSRDMLQVLNTDKTTSTLVLNILVLALVPALFEELFFRACLQTSLIRVFKSYHLAIWIGAFIFSLMHLQLDGFFVRVILGALLGYLYYYSGNLLLPILLHFVNNLRVVYLLFISKEFPADTDPSSAMSFGFYILALFSLLGTIVIIYYFYRLRKLGSESV